MIFREAVDLATGLAKRAVIEGHAVAALVKAGAIRPTGPVAAIAGVRSILEFGPIGGSVRRAAVLHGDDTGLVDDDGALTFRDLDERSNALANAWRQAGLGEQSVVGILCRNS